MTTHAWDIVERLRNTERHITWGSKDALEAADEIERLREALRQADLRMGFAMEGIRNAESK